MEYRMIIADDEDMLIRLIRKLGRFEALGIEIIDECHDGEEAYQSILKNRPDFVLTDIQMPVLDGLEMIEKVQPSVPDTLFVLISGFRYFEYARTAIKLNAVDYLLKPIDEKQLNLMLERLCRLTDERRHMRKDNESLQSFRESASQEKSREFLRELFFIGEGRPEKKLSPAHIEERFSIRFRYSCFRMLVMDYYLPQTSEMGRFSFVDKLNEMASTAFDGKIDSWRAELDGRFVILYNCAQENLGALSKALSTYFYTCKELHEIFGEFRMTFGLSAIKHSVAELPAASMEALDSAWSWLYFSGDQLIRYKQVDSMARIPIGEVFSESACRALQEGVRYLRSSALDESFGKIKKLLLATPYIYPGNIRQIYLLVRHAMENGIVDERREAIFLACENAIKGAWEPLQGFERVYQVAKEYIAEQQALIEQAGYNPVKKARDYIQLNYAGSISLDSVAEAVGISAAYLSRVFKEISGIGFNEYLTNVRLEESKRLLSDTKLPIHEVAVQVGYFDEKYYSKLFKKTFGIKPTEYRRLYG